LAPEPPASIIEAVARIDRELAAAQADMPDTSKIKPRELRMRVLLARRDGGDELALRVEECEERIRDAWDELRRLLAEEYLTGVGPYVRDDFLSAMRAPAPATASSYHDHFRAHSAALVRGRDVVAQISRQPARLAAAGSR